MSISNFGSVRIGGEFIEQIVNKEIEAGETAVICSFGINSHSALIVRGELIVINKSYPDMAPLYREWVIYSCRGIIHWIAELDDLSAYCDGNKVYIQYSNTKAVATDLIMGKLSSRNIQIGEVTPDQYQE